MAGTEIFWLLITMEIHVTCTGKNESPSDLCTYDLGIEQIDDKWTGWY